jgi:macrolide-specific efflux system membrane fusion protein
VSGQIKSMIVQVGQLVWTGDLIAEIDSTTQRNAVRNAEASVATNQAQRRAQEANLKLAESNLNRQRALLAEDATTRASVEQAEAQYASALAQMESTRAQSDQVQATLDNALANLAYTRILAPMDGTVVAVIAREGQTINAAQSSPTLVKLAKLDTVVITSGISEADVVRVRPGQTVYFTTLGDSKKRYYGKLRSVAPAPSSIEQDTGGRSVNSSGGATQAVYYNAVFEVPNPDGTLRIAMTAQVYVVLAEARQVPVIPAAALGPQGPDGTYTVRVADEAGVPQPRQIKVGINNSANAQVLEGLTEGERVVIGEAAVGAGPASTGGVVYFGP